MARRRQKRRTHVGAADPSGGNAAKNRSGNSNPKSMVIRIGAGEVGSSVTQLAQDVRHMMEPDTAVRLKERRTNKLRDYTTMAGPLGVSHLLLFSRSAAGNVNLRIALTPRGPTLHFRVERYSLTKDVQHAMKHPRGGGNEFLHHPLLVMNNFMIPSTNEEPPVPKHLESLVTTIFQSLFPAISPNSVPLQSIKRVMLLNREPPKPPISTSTSDASSYTLNLRHYAITTKRTGLSRPVRKINAAEKLLSGKSSKAKHSLPNLSKLADIADYILEDGHTGGFTSGSESEAETDAEVEVLEQQTRKVLTKKKLADAKRKAQAEDVGAETNGSKKDSKEETTQGKNVEKRAIKLVELGPRMKLRLLKVEEGVCAGKVMWHEYMSKSANEVEELERTWEERRRVKAERKRVQRENVERKRAEKSRNKKEGDEDEDDESEMWDSELDDDDFDDGNENEGEESGMDVDEDEDGGT